MSERDDVVWAVGQLRHLYAQMVRGVVIYPAEAARGLLGPAIAKLEPWATHYEPDAPARARAHAEGKAEGLEAAARVADAVGEEQTEVWEENGGEEGTPAFYLEGRSPTDAEWMRQGLRMGAAGGADATEETATRIRSLIPAAPLPAGEE